MNPKELEISYQENKQKFHDYVDNIKKKSPWDLFTIINPTLIKNPYTSDFPLRFFKRDNHLSNKYMLVIKSILKFYMKSIFFYFTYIIATLIYKRFYKGNQGAKKSIVIDIFGLVDKVNQVGSFQENYLVGIYEVLEKMKVQYSILIRPYQVGKNPFKLIKFFKIINEDKRDFIFEYGLLSFIDFIELFILIIIYPFKTCRFFQKENTDEDKIFNYSLIVDLKNFSFDSLTRYLLGKNLSQLNSIKTVYSWSEFQVIERSFNYGIRKNNHSIEIISLQFFLNYETYFNVFIRDLDFEMEASPHKVLVNGKYYVQDRKKIKYKQGVSLRYNKIFSFKGIKEEKNTLLLGSYIESDTKYMIKSVESFKSIIFKNHPAVDISRFGKLPNNITVSQKDIYQLFENAMMVIVTASGTAVEAVACGLSVIIVASQDNLTANPLVQYGKGKIWDIVFDIKDMNKVYDNLIQYRKEEKEEIKKISQWYKKNFFVEPNEENIKKVFEFKKEIHR